ncbi:LCP family protein [Streptomonospora wellingtoniae]|uniref:LCP family protein n=1 Tax=Streptomonospora wellingtoniae TaxID=3075544 RepID=A0ABU2KRW6_9ACTN|nr:LCP family protein [Streptomonospora sp. DSM 45055]MDT0301853.1 LCP family protein [Streptomonospora sp. DSM 45055]
MPDDAPDADSGAGSDRPQDSGPRDSDDEGSSPAPAGDAERDRPSEKTGEAGEAGRPDKAGPTGEPRGTGASGDPAAAEAAGEEGDRAGAEPGAAPDSGGTGDSARSGASAASSAEQTPAAAARRRRPSRLAALIAAAVVIVLVGGAGTAYGYFRSLQGNIVRHDLDTALNEEDRPERIGDDLNILFIGSDGREGGNAAYGGRDFVGERSDALMLAHVSTDGRVTVVNFPRDSLVRIPECDAYGETEGTAGYHGMINAALFHGGPPCVVKTIESLSGIRIDHFAHVSFVGFREMIDSIGGVHMCIPEPMHDERAQLDLDAGEQLLNGEEALSFVRARYEIGNGGDIGRIDRQQMFLGALADEVDGTHLLTQPSRATGMLQALSEHTGTDDDFTLPTMVSIASTLAGTDLSDIAFYTVPWSRAPHDPNRVVWDEDAAARLFSAVRHDRPVEDRRLVTGEQATGDAGAEDADKPGGRQEPHNEGAGASASPGADASSAPIEGRDATSDPCSNGLGQGTESAEESTEPQL